MLHNRYSLPMPNQSIPYKNYMKFWNNMAIIGGRIIHMINYMTIISIWIVIYSLNQQDSLHPR